MLVAQGINYSNASTPFPSDSFPGLIGQVTGGNPATTGIYYDDTWNHAVFPAGTKNCAGPAPGGEVAYTEADACRSSLCPKAARHFVFKPRELHPRLRLASDENHVQASPQPSV